MTEGEEGNLGGKTADPAISSSEVTGSDISIVRPDPEALHLFPQQKEELVSCLPRWLSSPRPPCIGINIWLASKVVTLRGVGCCSPVRLNISSIAACVWANTYVPAAAMTATSIPTTSSSTALGKAIGDNKHN